MEPVLPDRSLLRRAREQLDRWVFDGRDRAFTDLFDGPDAVVTGTELHQLDRIDSALSRQTGLGIWGSDEYGIITGQDLDEVPLRVVCTLHPEIPGEGYRGEHSLDEATRGQFNDVLFEYCERVAAYSQTDLERFLQDVQQPA
ncbi:DUF7539 family protein [Haloarchaeobius sp. TZWSO28]|uniref:DUF7539 family protein n=1 Tax=Haloarchaeobius sp. TZWSO28 TaxID=3446119 RepID=UPI003EB75026